MKKICALLIVVVFQISACPGQSAQVTTNVITRVFMVASKYGRGSIFSVDVDGREYWLTAKHVLTGAEHPPYGSLDIKSVSLQILDPMTQGEHWLPEQFSVIDPGKDIDIVVLAPPHTILDKPLPSVTLDSTGAPFGGDCEFLGFPYGGGWRATFEDGKSSWFPFIKHCTVSALNKETAKIWILDGINNSGFSGGPVIFQTGPSQKIMAVVSGYETELAQVNPSATRNDAPKLAKKASRNATVNLNSGFIVAYDVSYAVEAIHKNPIGPLRDTK